jgi:hypothetical protein
MATLPAICDDCGAIWGADNFIAGTGTVRGLHMTGNKVGPCPACKTGMGSIPDGVYDMENEVVNVVEASGVPTATLQSLVELLEARRRGEATDTEVIAAVQADLPGLAPTVESVLKKSDPIKWISLLLAVIGIYLQLQTPQPPTAEEIAHELRAKAAPTRIAPKKTKRKRPAKTYGKAKQRRSKKRH